MYSSMECNHSSLHRTLAATSQLSNNRIKVERRRSCCGKKATAERRQLQWKYPGCREVSKWKTEGIKKQGRERQLMESHMMETALLVFGFGLLCITMMTIQGILSLCQMSLDLQEQVAVWGTLFMARMKFGKCWLIQLVGKMFKVVAYQPH